MGVTAPSCTSRIPGACTYSGNGSFAAGGTLIGDVTTNGTTAWTFNASSFTQV